MKTWIYRSVVVILTSNLISLPAMAQSSSYLGMEKFSNSRGAEYTSGNQPGTVLMRVNLWGSVNRPGIHNVPVKTDLMSLMSYAGGPSEKARLDEVVIKREFGNTRKLIRVDVDELIKGVSHHHIELAPNDIVVVPKDKPLITRDTLALATVISLIASTVFTAVVIADRD